MVLLWEAARTVDIIRLCQRWAKLMASNLTVDRSHLRSFVGMISVYFGEAKIRR